MHLSKKPQDELYNYNMRALRIELNKIDDKTKTILGYLTYHAGKLWNERNYLLHNKLAKVNKYDIYNKIKNTSIHKKSFAIEYKSKE
jgi:putative transposase